MNDMLLFIHCSLKQQYAFSCHLRFDRRHTNLLLFRYHPGAFLHLFKTKLKNEKNAGIIVLTLMNHYASVEYIYIHKELEAAQVKSLSVVYKLSIQRQC